MSDRTPDRERFSLDLPFWLNGTLDADNSRWMEAYLRAHPECDGEHQFARNLLQLTRSLGSPIPEEERLESFRIRLRSTLPPPAKRLDRR